MGMMEMMGFMGRYHNMNQNRNRNRSRNEFNAHLKGMQVEASIP